jgi:metallophosphoesterase superfamily enzyme
MNSELKQLLETIIEQCCGKHALHPLESNVNGDYNVEITFSVDEIRKVLIAHGETWGEDWRNEWIVRRNPELKELL